MSTTTFTETIQFTTPTGTTVDVHVAPAAKPSNMPTAVWSAKVAATGQSCVVPVGKYPELDAQLTVACAANKAHTAAKTAEIRRENTINNEGGQGYNSLYHGGK